MTSADEFRRLRDDIPDSLPITQKLLDDLLKAPEKGLKVDLEYFAIVAISSIAALEKKLVAYQAKG